MHGQDGFARIWAMEIEVIGVPPSKLGLKKREIAAAARFFAEKSSQRVGAAWHGVTVHLVDDARSAQVHLEAMGIEGPTDAITLSYDAIPPEQPGLYGELFVNFDQALRVAKTINRKNWSPRKELLLYIAHGMDHLSGADDASDADYRRMRRRELRWIALSDL